MKKVALLSLVLLLSLSSACSGQGPSEPATPCSLEELGYRIDLEQVPELLRQDTFLGDEEDHALPALPNASYSTVEFSVYSVLDAEPQIALLLQAVPAKSQTLQLPGAEAFPVADWADYLIFQNKDILLFDLYPLVVDGEATLPERLRQEAKAREAQLQEKLDGLMAGLLEDESQWRDLSFGLTDTRGDSRYLDYLWAYYHDNIGELIVPLE